MRPLGKVQFILKKSKMSLKNYKTYERMKTQQVVPRKVKQFIPMASLSFI